MWYEFYHNNQNKARRQALIRAFTATETVEDRPDTSHSAQLRRRIQQTSAEGSFRTSDQSSSTGAASSGEQARTGKGKRKAPDEAQQHRLALNHNTKLFTSPEAMAKHLGDCQACCREALQVMLPMGGMAAHLAQQQAQAQATTTAPMSP